MQNRNPKWDAVNLSQKNTIKQLLKFRSLFSEFDNYGDVIIESNDLIMQEINEDIICIYVSLDDLIDRCNFNKKQEQIIDLLQMGYSEIDIADKFKNSIQSVNKTIDNICNKIVDMNNYLWKHEFLYWDFVKTKYNYKKCNKCNEWLPEIEEFYYKTIDGYLFNRCKNCFG